MFSCSSEGNEAESDSIESDSIESDSIESDSIESDSIESDSIEPDSVEPDSIELVRNGVSRYKIGYPSLSRAEDIAAVLDVVDAFKEATGIVLPTENDMKNGIEEGASDTPMILIGKTNYAESKEAYDGLRHQEYKVEVNGANIVIAAFTSSGYNAAIEWLKEEVFSGFVNGTLTMSRDMRCNDSIVTGYRVQSWTIDGVSLEKFKIVYADKEYAVEMSKIIEKIAVRTGYYLDLVLDSESEPTQYEILIGDTNRAESAEVDVEKSLHYNFKTVNGKLVIKSGGKHSYIKLLDELADIITKEASVITMTDSYFFEGNFMDDTYDISMSEEADLRIMDANLMAQIYSYAEAAFNADFEFERRAEIFFAALEFYTPTVVGVQECCLQWREAIKSYRYYDEKWQLLEFKNPNVTETDPDDKVYTSIMFRKDLYELVDSGMQYYSEFNNMRCRNFTWALLRDKATGQEFCFISSHWDGGIDKVTDTESTVVQGEELTSFVNYMALDYPVFVVGDFNRSETTPTYKKYLEDTGAVDCKHVAENLVNPYWNSGHNWGQTTNWSISLDHITTTQKTVDVLRFETLLYNEQIWASDHSWLLADVKFK